MICKWHLCFFFYKEFGYNLSTEEAEEAHNYDQTVSRIYFGSCILVAKSFIASDTEPFNHFRKVWVA